MACCLTVGHSMFSQMALEETGLSAPMLDCDYLYWRQINCVSPTRRAGLRCTSMAIG